MATGIGIPAWGATGARIGRSAADDRQLIQAAYSSFGVKRGCTVTTSSSDKTYTVAAGVAIASRGTAYGAVEFPVPAGTVTTTAGPASGTRTDIVYALQHDPSQGDADGLVVLGVAQALPVGAVELRRYTVPAGMTTTSQATVAASVQYAIPYGASLGVLSTWTDTWNTTASQDWAQRGNGSIFLPTDRLLEMRLSVCISSVDANNGGVCRHALMLDGVQVTCFEREYDANWTTTDNSFLVPASAGSHTVSFYRGKRAGADFVQHYGTVTDSMGTFTFPGTVFSVIDRGVSA